MLPEHRTGAAVALANITFLRTLPFTLALTTVASSHADAVAVALCREIAIWLFNAAFGACLVPHLAHPPMPNVQPLVRDSIDTFQVRKPVVRTIMIPMVDLIARMDGAMSLFPYQAMFADNAPVIEFDLRVSIAAEPAPLSVFRHAREVAPAQESRYSVSRIFRTRASTSARTSRPADANCPISIPSGRS